MRTTVSGPMVSIDWLPRLARLRPRTSKRSAKSPPNKKIKVITCGLSSKLRTAILSWHSSCQRNLARDMWMVSRGRRRQSLSKMSGLVRSTVNRPLSSCTAELNSSGRRPLMRSSKRDRKRVSSWYKPSVCLSLAMISPYWLKTPKVSPCFRVCDRDSWTVGTPGM